ncbi:MAG: cytochrome c oxidase subunit II [Halarchaeum sp.]
MDIHRYEKIWIGVSLVFIVGLMASIVYGVVAVGATTVGDSGETVAANDLSNTTFGDPGGHWASDDHYVVNVVAQQFQFRPGTREPVVVPANTTVTFRLTSPDVVHGFEVVGTSVNAMVIPGQVTVATTRFDRPTTYGVVCNEYCGAGHQNMEGQIVVVPRETLRNASANGTAASLAAPSADAPAGGVA